MKKITSCLALLALLAFTPAAEAARFPELNYTVNLNDRADDRFKVTLDLKGLKSDNDVFQFASTAPGTYQVMDMGRFVSDFKAFDRKGREVEVKQISTNQWQLTEPEKVRQISYKIAETFDTPVEKDKIYGMCGTSLEADHAMINGQGVFGFVKGLQAAPLRLQLQYPNEWMVGTALQKDRKGTYLADSYDHIVDSPILLGNLTKAQTTFNNTTIDVYTYSKTGKIKSEDLLQNLNGMLDAANKFVVNFPVDRYTFLYFFEDQDWGAWEHSYSSGYVLQERDLTPEFANYLTDIAAHEFFHIITPLNIHSEVVAQFNFEKPTPSQHLWLYEGTTEWASDMMRLRAGLIDLPAYFEDLRTKLLIDDKMDKTYSLQKLSLTSFTPEGHQQYGNIYNRGGITAALLDLRLLELSDGKRGLREVINELSKEYGPKKSFPENEFFDIFTARTYPEIGDFFNRYVKNADPLPLADYYNKVGITYKPAARSGKKVSALGYTFGVANGSLVFSKVNPEVAGSELQNGDVLFAKDGTEITMQNAQQELGKLAMVKPGDVIAYTVIRNGEKKNINLTVQEKDEELKHVFELDEQASPKQVALRNKWLKNS